jgi:2-C-methyl-D-erythritol 4-phosphate cytidylyltransferase
LPDAPVAVVLAAGVGARVGGDEPKQFLDLNGVPVLERTVRSLVWCERIVVVHHPEHEDRTRALVEHAGLGPRVTLVAGGATRRSSIAAALAALTETDDDVPLVLQNAASPRTPRELVQACLAGLSTHDVVQAYVPAVHTIFSHDGRELTEVLPRNGLGYSADPTVYRLGCLRRIVEAQSAGSAAGEMTLDTARALGIPVLLVPSPASNIKLTTAADVLLLRTLIDSPPETTPRLDA